MIIGMFLIGGIDGVGVPLYLVIDSYDHFIHLSIIVITIQVILISSFW